MPADDTSPSYWYGIRLLIKHPSRDPDSISHALNLNPSRTWRAGEPRRTPKGAPLPGVYADSYWGYGFSVEGGRDFSKGVADILDLIEPHAAFLSEIVASGGKIQLVVELDGTENIGDTFDSSDLRRLAALPIDFGIEVFPWVKRD